jgi:ABC-type branched-subunit amino acid transport system ATPase component
MAQGRLLVQDKPKAVAADTRVQEVYLGAPEEVE